mmetsp:Transcript_15244/g.32018  ORF Transcript_15244/g.32018 Transcript_15244/m.32018 type:complete len:437 (-) Transcript_15244:1676-2986(-)
MVADQLRGGPEEGGLRVDLHRVRVLHGHIGAILPETRGVIEEAGEDRFPDAVDIVWIARHLDLNLFEHVHKLFSDISCTLQGPVLKVILHAPIQRESSLLPLLIDVHQSQVITADFVEVLPRIVCMQPFVLGPVEDRVVHPQHAADREDLVHTLVLLRCDEHLRQHGVHGEFRHAASSFREIALVVQGAQRVELLQRLDERLRGRRVHEVKVKEVIDANGLQHEDHVPEIRPLDLRSVVVVELVLERPLRVETEALPRQHPTCPASSLVRGGLGAGHHDQRFHACARIERVLLTKARVDDIDDVVNGNGSLRDVRSEDHLPSPLWRFLEDLRLHVRRESGVDGQHEQLAHRCAKAASLGADRVYGLLDLLLPGKENQDVPQRLCEMDLEDGDNASVEVIRLWGLCVVNANRVASTRDVENGRVVEVFRELLSVQGR